jgi:cell division septum initiation protein DivIVA
MTSDNGSATPEFTTAIRGYDKLQVDEYVAHLRDFAEDAESRARAAESELEVTRHTTVGPRVGEIFELAVTEAKDLQDRARTECDKRIAEGRDRAAEIVAEAQEREAEASSAIEREKEEARAEIEAQRRRAELEIEQLRETKAALHGDLRRLQEVLTSATGITAPRAGEALEADETVEIGPAPEPERLPVRVAS